jgi:hypothetical protein
LDARGPTQPRTGAADKQTKLEGAVGEDMTNTREEGGAKIERRAPTGVFPTISLG